MIQPEFMGSAFMDSMVMVMKEVNLLMVLNSIQEVNY